MVYTVDGVNCTRRTKILVTGAGSGAQTDFQIKLAATWAEAMQADFDDVRFTKADKQTLIDAWLESKVDSTSADIWVEFLTTPADGVEETEAYMYFGDVGAVSDWDGAATFISFFDGSSTGWTEVDPNSHISFANNRLEWAGLDRDEDAYVYQSASVNGDITIEYTYEITSFTDTGYVTIGVAGDMLDDYNNLDNGIQSISNYFRTSANDVASSGKRVSDATSNGGDIVIVKETQYWVRTTIDRSGDCVTKIYSNAARTSQVGADSTVSVLDVAATLQYIYLISTLNTAQGAREISGWMDDFTVRKYAANPPTAAFGTEEHQRRTPIMM